ncbi:polysaccharide deacetylase family protein [Georgenia thermotolerans]|uniref:Polysaccharide deacetylase family protein n=1 Tax=Georgenia thermotolerans TaxID=527326 RepID=A0A7J5URY3_9MICO|nr:polysaccharide deacetylase family protein [Georgenia thermotolerans]KAE8764894.1 polysaccharide deacetylase family protein [Georgenia thermotolerans]
MTGTRVLNICFHGIGTPRRPLEPGESAYWISAEAYLRILDEVMTWPGVRLSFDDGNASDLALGVDALEERGLHATFFVLAGRLGTAGSLSPDDVLELRRRGMTLGTHGMDHRSWRGMDPRTARVELVDARARLAELIGASVEEAALPRGEYDRHVLRRLRSLGYAAVHTSDRRSGRTGAWLQPRFSVRTVDTAASLRAEVLHASRAAWAASWAKGLVKRWR